MARPIRFNRPGTVYHHIWRLVDRGWFIADSDDRALYLRLLARAFKGSDWLCIAYAVMSNHIHLCNVAGKTRLEEWARRVNAPFARWMNTRHKGLGQKFVRGPTDFEVPPERVARTIAYIHNNPVRAGVVAHPSASCWTSHQAYVGLAPVPPWLHVDEGLRRAAFSDAAAFDRFVAENPTDSDIEELLARRVRNDDDEQIAEPDPHHSKRPRLADPGAIVLATAKLMGVSVEQLRSKRRGAREVLGRRLAVSCAQRSGLTGADIARALNITQQSASWMLRQPPPPPEQIEAVLGSDTNCTSCDDETDQSAQRQAEAVH